MSGDPKRNSVVPDFLLGALFTFVLLASALAFASHKTQEQKQEDRSRYGQVVGQARKAGLTKQECDGDQDHRSTAGIGSFDALTDWLLDVKLSDLLLVAFTAVLAWKTAGLDKSTRDLWEASRLQRKDNLSIAAGQSRDMRSSIEAARDAAFAAKRSADAVVAVETPKLVLSSIRIHAIYDKTGTSSIRLGLQNPTAICEIRNYGRSPAFLAQSSCDIFLGGKLPDEPDYQNVLTLPFNAVVDGGETHELDAARYATLGLSNDEVAGIMEDKITPLGIRHSYIP
ncbi:hypothetical protein [Lichenifustis flavocetrariae]|uniref:Uncharacterized protein n=1 Tax=Lichenifustis flavocetrariae TaxID=2949735 RepID=A0AA41YXA1_9HYPH|nr:hypothetical protein [Lichenifustis flavocetrariae]MCW6508872.1 hypothetical protein [Lichenifustis flavocetrariae]